MSGLKCIVIGCGGTLDFKNPYRLQTGCHSYSAAFACNKCGRLHSDEGVPYFNRPGNPVYAKIGLLKELHLLVWQFPNESAMKRRDIDTAQSVLVGEACKVSDLEAFSGLYLCHNPRSNRFMSLEVAKKALSKHGKK